ncbi:peptidase S8 [Aliidiomarina minuta]|uniref:Peptidase S8 n=1 Tax=Aliidiomarina minuta TaxID=880057 RepID=A0A432WA51_9GAMM|nr:S8 family serine peptidase [Aliidiomarina minuta]RUO27030.1 peptidase S8 [Aliidiomarina minuta]
MTNKKTLVVGISLALFAGSAMAANKQAEDDSLLVVFKDQISKEERLETIRGVGGMMRETDALGRDLSLRNVANGRINKIRVANAQHRDRVMKRLSQHPLVQVAEPNYIISINNTHTEFNPLSIPNDPAFGDMWALQNTGQQGGTAGADISAVPAWDITTGSQDIVIGVIDTGVDYTHPDLAANMWLNPNEICDSGVDDSGTGVIDDCYGYSAITGYGDPMDGNGHGTHVAGTIGAVGNNELGVVGVNWNVQMVACQFLDADGFGSTAGAIECVDYFTNLKLNHGVNIVASNNSWGGGAYSEALEMAISDGIDAGIMFVAASGNDGTDSDVIPSYPASYDLDGIVAVANTTRTDAMSGTSTYGLESVDLGAPGTQILSTYLNEGYATASGTSMASPHVAGVAGLIWSISPQLSITEVKQIMMDSGDPLSALAGRTVSGNRLNAYQALIDADPDPGFRLSLSPMAQEIEAGSYAEYSLEVGSLADWSGEVELTASVSPELDVELSSTTAEPGDEVTVTVYTEANTAWGEYSVVISGTDAETGELTGEAQGALHVFPQGIVDIPFENNTPIDIPDADPEGISSIISVSDEGTVFGTEVSVNITHTWIGDLIVTLTSPEGTEHVLHDRAGGSADDLIETWNVGTFNGESMTGDWTLHVSDNAAFDTGTLNSWGLVLSVATEDDGVPGPPAADFSYSVDGMTVNFTDESEADSDIMSYEWDFGDGASSTNQNPQHTYAEEGTYSVTLTVTDEEELSDSVTKSVTIALSDIDVSVLSGVKLRTGSAIVQLRWSGAEGAVDIYRDGEFVETVSGMERYRDRFETDQDDVHYEVCPEGSQAGCGSATYQF